MKRFLLLFLPLAFINISSFAQDTINPISISLDLMSRYVWRGTQIGDSPSIQPGIEYSKKNFTIGAWGAYATNLTGAQEADLYMSYTFKDKYSLTLTDYFFPDASVDYHYFDYTKNSTGHILEATISFEGTDKLPLSVILATNFFGADAHKINKDGSKGAIMYSTYTELTYSFKYFDAFIGANLTDANEERGEAGLYGNNIGIVNLGIKTTKTIKITDSFSLPLSMSVITNPQAEKIFFVAGLSF